MYLFSVKYEDLKSFRDIYEKGNYYLFIKNAQLPTYISIKAIITG